MIVGMAVETTVCSSELTVIAIIRARVTSPRSDRAAPAASRRVLANRAVIVPASTSAIVPSPPVRPHPPARPDRAGPPYPTT